MALNVKDVEVIEEKTNAVILDHILFCLFGFVLLSCMFFLVTEILLLTCPSLLNSHLLLSMLCFHYNFTL